MIQVADHVVDLLNTDAELDHFRRDAPSAPALRPTSADEVSMPDGTASVWLLRD
jgi:hypothetical protein